MDNKTFLLEIKEFDETGTFEGYAAVFGNEDLGGDVIERGAFKKTLKEQPTVPILWQHDQREPIGVSVEMSEDDKGLRVKGQLNLETQRGREAYALMKQKALRGLSIGYDTVKELWDGNLRKLKELRVWEWSPVTFPMNTLATVTAVKMTTESLLAQVIRACEEAKSTDTEIDPALIETARAAIEALAPNEPGKPTPPGEPQTKDKPVVFDHLFAELSKLNTN